jgi:hypothetical protein
MFSMYRSIKLEMVLKKGLVIDLRGRKVVNMAPGTRGSLASYETLSEPVDGPIFN